jgi:hypothetical protein
MPYFSELGVRVRRDVVSAGLKQKPLAGAEAVITEGGRVHRYGAGAAAASLSFGLGAVTALSKKSKASAIVAFADGTTHERKLSGNREVRNAQADAVKFNALARAATIRSETEAMRSVAPPVEEPDLEPPTRSGASAVPAPSPEMTQARPEPRAASAGSPVPGQPAAADLQAADPQTQEHVEAALAGSFRAIMKMTPDETRIFRQVRRERKAQKRQES